MSARVILRASFSVESHGVRSPSAQIAKRLDRQAFGSPSVWIAKRLDRKASSECRLSPPKSPAPSPPVTRLEFSVSMQRDEQREPGGIWIAYFDLFAGSTNMRPLGPVPLT